jgi:hypothetical protein
MGLKCERTEATHKKLLDNKPFLCYNKGTKKGKELNTMTTYTINIQWYNEIKDRVPHGEPYIYREEDWQMDYAEVDVQEDIFIEVSRKLGWM